MSAVLRSALWLGFFAAILAAWIWLYVISTGMGLDLLGRPDAVAEAMRRMDPRMDMDMPMARFGPLFAMWAVMMAAMMLPTMIPTLRTYEDLIVSAGGSRGGWLSVIAGYGLVWAGFAAIIAAVQLLLLFGGFIDMLGIAASAPASGVLLVAVGAFQFTSAKQTCHGVCHSPIGFFLSRWRSGVLGGLRMGFELGAWCIGCCWGFMALGFAGGMMNLAWMGLATLAMVLEKIPAIGHLVIRPVGVVLILAGTAVIAYPLLHTEG